MHDLLTEPLIGVNTHAGPQRLSLPELLAALSQGTITSYTGLRAHQADPWHVFLVQLAASIQARRPTNTLPTEAAYWREGLLDLAEGQAEAWHLVVEDVTQPAFLQHPWASQEEAQDYGLTLKRGQAVWTPKATTPDELDVLVTAKNHDVKLARQQPDDAEAWVYALVMLQTTSGYLGQGNFGIVRMNGGFASRAILAWTLTLEPSARFVADTQSLIALREPTMQKFGYAKRGIVLTALTRWDRSAHQYLLTPPTPLEPWFIEACRPVRLRRIEDGRLIALSATSKARQIGPKTLENGDVGDPWTAINVSDKKKGRSALTLSSDGFTPQKLTDLLFEQGYELSPLQKPQPGDTPGWFSASCLVRGQGTTEGYHQVTLPVPAKARTVLFQRQSRETLAHLAQKLLSDVRDVQKALATALTVLTEGGPEKADFERVEDWIKAARADFARQWEPRYFPTLWRGADEEHAQVRQAWQQTLVDLAQDLLDQAAARLPLPTNRRWRALTQAQGAWIGMLKKLGLPLPRQSTPQPLPEMSA